MLEELLEALIELIVDCITWLCDVVGYKNSEYKKQTGLSYWKVTRDAGREGEYRISKKLRSLKGYKRFLFNCYLPKDDGGTTEVDVIMLHESGIYVFESKNYSGWIFGSEKDSHWVQSLKSGRRSSIKNRFFNPIIQNRVHVKWLSGFLGMDKDDFLPYVVFGNDCELKKINLESEQRVVNLSALKDMIRSDMKYCKNYMTAVEIDTLYDKLYPLTQVSQEVKDEHVEEINNKYKTPTAKEKSTSANRRGYYYRRKSGKSSTQTNTAKPIDTPIDMTRYQ